MDENISLDYEVFKKLMARTSKVLFAYDVEAGSITSLSPAFSHLWNRRRESAIANPSIVLDSVHPDDREHLINEYNELLGGAAKPNVEFRIVTPDETVIWLLLTPLLFTDGEGRRSIAGIVEDISDAKDNTSNLQKFAAKKNAILEILSHDLAGPLATIQSLADALSESTESYRNEEVNKFIRIIRDSSERSLNMIRDFVQWEFLEAVDAAMVKRRVNVVEKVKEVMDQYKDGEPIINKDFRFTFSSDKLYAYIDQDKLMQALNNLVSNAIKFSQDGAVIAVDVSEQETSLLLSVKDNGIGIPIRFHDVLFERFTPARREGIKGEPSTGLGMSIIKTIVEWHKGSIRFDSEEGVGTTFFIEIPKE